MCRLVKRDHDLVTSNEPGDTLTNGDDVTRCVGARDNLILDLERIFAGSNCNVSEVQSNASHFDEDLMLAGCGSGLLECGELFPRVAASETEGGLSGHFDVKKLI